MVCRRLGVRVLCLLVWIPAFALALEIPAGLLSSLKSEEFRKRESAQQELLKWGRLQPEAAMDLLYHQSRAADDPEVRERCLGVLRELVNDEYLKDGEGYIGIRMNDEMAVVPEDPKPRGAIRVLDVMADSAGERAGLLRNDLIVGLEDQVWHETSALEPFRERIRQRKPNTKVTLKLLRNGKLMDLKVTLGRRPSNADNPFMQQPGADLEALERNEKDAYFRRWLERRKQGN